MKKSLLIGAGVVIVVIVGLLFFFQQKAKAPGVAETASPQTMTPPSTETLPTAIDSIKDAMGLNKKMLCTYTSESGETDFTSTVAVDGTKFKTESTVGALKTHALFDGETQYMWTEGQSQGFKMSKSCLDELKESIKDLPTGTPGPKDYETSFDAAQNVKCEESGAIDFSLPTNVTFTDQCEMMNKNLEMMNQIKDKMPAGMPTQY